MEVKDVLLTDEEAQLASHIGLRRRGSNAPDHDDCAAMERLAKSVIKRGAIPEIHIRFIEDPALNIGSKLSRRQIFEDNGTRSEEMLRHPHFFRHLQYFIYGPNLPTATVHSFAEAVGDPSNITSGDIEPLKDLAKSEYRKLSLSRKQAAVEFYKLGLECGLDLGYARHIYDTIMKTK